ncbi:putative zinc ribbon protein [Citrobacter amalonaticus]
MTKKQNGKTWQAPIRWICRQCNRQYSGERVCPFCYCVDHIVTASGR